jgi:hypothetical protein
VAVGHRVEVKDKVKVEVEDKELSIREFLLFGLRCQHVIPREFRLSLTSE